MKDDHAQGKFTLNDVPVCRPLPQVIIAKYRRNNSVFEARCYVAYYNKGSFERNGKWIPSVRQGFVNEYILLSVIKEGKKYKIVDTLADNQKSFKLQLSSGGEKYVLLHLPTEDVGIVYNLGEQEEVFKRTKSRN